MTDSRDHDRIEVVIPVSRANIWAFGVFISSFVLFGLLYSVLNGSASLWSGVVAFLTNYKLLIPAIVVGGLLHELLHAIGFVIGGASGWSAVSFGFNLRQLAPYVHFNVAVSRKRFIIATLMPGILLGVVPVLLSIAFDEPWFFTFGIFFTAGAGGDFLTVVNVFSFGRDTFIQDHPSCMGFFVIKPSDKNQIED